MARISTVSACWSPGWAARMSRQMLSACSGSLMSRYCSAFLIAFGTAAVEIGLSSKPSSLSLTLRLPPPRRIVLRRLSSRAGPRQVSLGGGGDPDDPVVAVEGVPPSVLVGGGDVDGAIGGDDDVAQAPEGLVEEDLLGGDRSVGVEGQAAEVLLLQGHEQHRALPARDEVGVVDGAPGGGDRRGPVLDAVASRARPAVVVAALEVVDLVAPVRAVLGGEEPARGGEAQALHVSVTLGEDGRLPGGRVEPEDLAVEAAVVLGRLLLVGVARPDVEGAVMTEGQPAAVVNHRLVDARHEDRRGGPGSVVADEAVVGGRRVPEVAPIEPVEGDAHQPALAGLDDTGDGLGGVTEAPDPARPLGEPQLPVLVESH